MEDKKKTIEKVLERLKAGTEAVFESENYKELLKVTAKLYHYSLNNCILIAMQCPGATYVAGYQMWQREFKRNVKKGEKGIRIIAPCSFKKWKEEDLIDPKSGKPVIGPDGKAMKKKEEVEIPSYKVAYVYDVSQTAGEPLPELVHDLNGDVERYVMYKSVLEKIAPCSVHYAEIEGNAHGYYDLANKKIVVQEGMSQEQTLKTLVHEITHAQLHDKDTGSDNQVGRRAAEVEAESVAFAVCEYLGIDSSDYSFGYVASWSQGKELEELKACLSTIHGTAVAMIKNIEKNLIVMEEDADCMQTELDMKKKTVMKL